MGFSARVWPNLTLAVLLTACNGAPPKSMITVDTTPMDSAATSVTPAVAQPQPTTSSVSTATATAVSTSVPSASVSQPAADAGAAPSCGYVPAARVDKTGFGVPSNAGCGLAPATAEPHKSVVSIDVVSLTLAATRTIVELVFLDANKRRLLPIGRKLSFDFRFKHRQRGQLRLKQDMHTEGVFKIELRGNARAKPCSSHLFLRLHNGKKLIEEWVDDWLYGC